MWIVRDRAHWIQRAKVVGMEQGHSLAAHDLYDGSGEVRRASVRSNASERAHLSQQTVAEIKVQRRDVATRRDPHAA